MINIRVLQYTTIAMELASFIAGILCWQKVKHNSWRWFVYYLGFIVAGEILCNILSYTLYSNIVNLIYTYCIIPVEFLFLYGLYYRHLAGKKNKILVALCAIVFLASIVSEPFFFEGTDFIFDSFSYSIGNLLLLIIIVVFFLQFSKSEEILQYGSSMIFWVSLGALVFYLGTLPYYGLMHLLYDKHRQVFNYYTNFAYAFGWLMYLLFIIGFIRWKPK